MIRTLVGIRFRALFAGLTAQSAKRKKRQSAGMILLYVFLYLYVLVVFGGMMCLAFSSLAEPYHILGLDWLYFSIAGMMGLSFCVLGSAFTTQNQLYDAKDNDLLLSMPVTPKAILVSRMIPLLAMNLLFAGIIMIPATVMYAVLVGFSPAGVLLQLLTLFGVCVLSQAIASLLGWLLHLLLRKLNKSLASVLYLVVFFGMYFYLYSQAGSILQSLAASGQQIAAVLQSWVWPLYAMGQGSTGSIPHFLFFAGICILCFAAVYWFLSVTFLRTATASQRSQKKRKLDMSSARVASPAKAVAGKELRKFLGSPVYLTNMGLGVVLTAALPVAALIFRRNIAALLAVLDIQESAPLIICAVLAFTTSATCISTPSVSLEGKNIWILKSMPISSKKILLAKLNFHVLMVVPITVLAGLILAITFGCDPVAALLSAVTPGLLALLNGLLGLWAGLQWAKLDYINEAYPCKQSVAILVAMFGMMGISLLLGICWVALMDFLNPAAFLALCALVLSAACFGFYRLIVTWGVKKWESL